MAAADASNPIQIENAKAGTTDWKITNLAFHREIEGYASLTSVNRGGQISLFVNTGAPSYTLEIFRMGWYGGTGGRRMTAAIQLPGIQQPAPTTDPVTGLTECAWTNPYVLNIPNSSSDPSDWASGVYLAKLTASDSGKQRYIIFAVRDDARASDYFFPTSVLTDQAYNNWGGKSLYSFNSSGGAARKVSFKSAGFCPMHLLTEPGQPRQWRGELHAHDFYHLVGLAHRPASEFRGAGVCDVDPGCRTGIGLPRPRCPAEAAAANPPRVCGDACSRFGTGRLWRRRRQHSYTRSQTAHFVQHRDRRRPRKPAAHHVRDPDRKLAVPAFASRCSQDASRCAAPVLVKTTGSPIHWKA